MIEERPMTTPIPDRRAHPRVTRATALRRVLWRVSGPTSHSPLLFLRVAGQPCETHLTFNPAAPTSAPTVWMGSGSTMSEEGRLDALDELVAQCHAHAEVEADHATWGPLRRAALVAAREVRARERAAYWGSRAPLTTDAACEAADLARKIADGWADYARLTAGWR